MAELDPSELKRIVEAQHGCMAKLAQSVPVNETFEGKAVWQGVVHVFDIVGNPLATRAYAWSSPRGDDATRRFYAVLHRGPVTGPVEAVRAAIVAERRSGG